jgi:hypothetical protein
MSDESQLQVTPKVGDSSLSLSRVRTGLFARGLRDAAMLPVWISRVTRETARASVAEGICNKCGERKGDVPTSPMFGNLLAGVCGSCRDSLDKEWADVTATDWVFVAVLAHPGRAIFDRLRVNPPPSDPLLRYTFRNTTYPQMKLLWEEWNGMGRPGRASGRLSRNQQLQRMRPR